MNLNKFYFSLDYFMLLRAKSFWALEIVVFWNFNKKPT